jgi:hypothetical protein
MLGVVSVGLTTVVASVDAPVIVPDPLIVIAMIYSSAGVLPRPPAGKVTPAVPEIVVAMICYS